MDGVVVRVTIVLMKHHDHGQGGEEERAYLAYTSVSLFITAGSQIETQTGQEPGGRS